jgi:hypothetical protein
MIATLTCLAFAAGPVSAQDSQPVDWQPVDQTVADLDLRATSNRVIEQGISTFGQTGTLYRRSLTDPMWTGQGQLMSQQYMLRRPGFTAYLDQPDYIVRGRDGEIGLNVAPSQDGRAIDKIPPNTVFDLVYRPSVAPVPVPLYDPLLDTMYINTSTSTWIDGDVAGEPGPALLPPPPVAHSLPPHLIERRIQHLAEAQARQAAGEDDPTEETPTPAQETNDAPEP